MSGATATCFHVQLSKDGDRMGVRTDHRDPECFLNDFSEAVGSLIDDGEYQNDWGFQLDRWLPCAMEIVLALRGWVSEAKWIKEMLVTDEGLSEHEWLVSGDWSGGARHTFGYLWTDSGARLK